MVLETIINPFQQEFARKLIRVPSGTKPEIDAAIANEIRVIEKLCKDDVHPNIIAILKHGWLNNDQYYFFDMELCVMNLANFIDADLKPSQYLNPACPEDGLECLSLWRIMHDITSGLAHIHRHRELHRDIKPRNGLHTPLQANIQS